MDLLLHIPPLRALHNAVAGRVDAVTQAKRAQFMNSQPVEGFLGPRGVMRFLTTKRGARLCSYYWPAENAKAVVMICHGHGAYLCFDFLNLREIGSHHIYDGSWIQALNAAGYSVCGIDLEGSGRSDGLFGYVRKWQHHVQDLALFAKLTSATDLPGFVNLPVFGLGGSLGGCLVLHAALADPTLFKGISLLAPMLSLERVARQGWNKYLVPLARLLELLVPTWPLARTAPCTRFPELEADHQLNPATYSAPTRVHTAAEYVRACDDVMARLGAVTTPLLVFHSEGDTLTDPAGSKALYEQAKAPDKTMRTCSHMWHVLLREPGCLELQKEVIEWMDQRCPAAVVAGGGGVGGVGGVGVGAEKRRARSRTAAAAVRR